MSRVTQTSFIALWKRSVPVQLALCFIVIPTVVRSVRVYGLSPVDLTFTYALTLLGWVLINNAARTVWQRRTVVVLCMLYYTTEAFITIYEIYSTHIVHLYFVLDSLSAALPTALAVMGIERFFILLACLGFVAVYTALLFAHGYARKAPKRILTSWLLILAGALCLSTNSRVIQEIYASNAYNDIRMTIPAIVPDNSAFTTESDDNVFILQLESGNALAAEGYFEPEGRRPNFLAYSMPALSALKEHGVFAPLFWGNAMMTNRAQEVILCRIALNLHRALSFRLHDVPDDCLPALLARDGYDTVAYRSDVLSFANEGEFFKKTGFQEVHHDDILQPGDQTTKNTSFGIDDCTFYRRVFEDLKKRHSDKKHIFTYVEVSMSHYPFTVSVNGLPQPVENPMSFKDHYINANAQQDACLQVFYEEYQKFAPENSHLFILPDHSWPVGHQQSTVNQAGAWPENFMINLLYVPPTRDADQYDIGGLVQQRFSQTDLIGTIFDLLNGTRSAQSFAPALRKNEALADSYDDCHVLTQPYDNGNVVAVHGNNYFLYKLTERTVTAVNLEKDLLGDNPNIIARDVDFAHFWATYGCDKYRNP